MACFPVRAASLIIIGLKTPALAQNVDPFACALTAA